MDDIKEIENKQLGCFCKPHECHGDILLKILQEQTRKQTASAKTPAVACTITPEGAGATNQKRTVGGNQIGPRDATKQLTVLMDSNRRHIDFHALCTDAEIQVNRCGTAADARNLIEQHHIGCPTDILLHVGINDLESNQPMSVAADIEDVALRASERFPNCTVHVSLIPPRSDELRHEVIATNNLLRKAFKGNSPNVKIIDHKDISEDHLYDKKHLRLKRINGQALSGTQLLAKNFYKSIYSMNPYTDILYSSRRMGFIYK